MITFRKISSAHELTQMSAERLFNEVLKSVMFNKYENTKGFLELKSLVTLMIEFPEMFFDCNIDNFLDEQCKFGREELVYLSNGTKYIPPRDIILKYLRDKFSSEN